MALTTTQTSSSKPSSSKLTVPLGEKRVPRRAMAPPGLLRCLVVSWSDQRAELFRAAAESEAWQAVVCQDMGQFMRHVFRMKVPLTIVDLPRSDAAGYAELREAAVRSRDVSKSLLVVSVAQASAVDELWIRQLGVWAHLPEASDPAGLEMVFREARKALARQAICHSESMDIRDPQRIENTARIEVGPRGRSSGKREGKKRGNRPDGSWRR